MKVFLYRRPHDLPCSKKPAEHVSIFDPKQALWKAGIYDESFGNLVPRYFTKQFKDTFAWPIILGLHKNCMEAVAHVSFAVDEHKLYRHRRSSFQIQITANILVQGVVKRICLYGACEFPGSLWQHLAVKNASSKERDSPQFWNNLFSSELRSLKALAHLEAERSEERAQKLIQEAEELRAISRERCMAFLGIGS